MMVLVTLHTTQWVMEHPFSLSECEHACLSGDLAAVQACIVGKRGVRGMYHCFRAAWTHGHIHVVRWLASAFGTTLATNVHVACVHGMLDFAQWLHAANKHTRFTPTVGLFRTVCSFGLFEVAQWLHSFGTVTATWVAAAFSQACRYGHLEIAEWLHSLGPVDIHADGDKALCETVITGCVAEGARYKVARWLLSLDPEYTAWPEDVLRSLRCWSACRDVWMRSVTVVGRPDQS
jgi:hypothetical protein